MINQLRGYECGRLFGSYNNMSDNNSINNKRGCFNKNNNNKTITGFDNNDNSNSNNSQLPEVVRRYSHLYNQLK